MPVTRWPTMFSVVTTSIARSAMMGRDRAYSKPQAGHADAGTICFISEAYSPSGLAICNPAMIKRLVATVPSVALGYGAPRYERESDGNWEGLERNGRRAGRREAASCARR